MNLTESFKEIDMKKLETWKTIQFIIFILFSILCFFTVVTNGDVQVAISNTPALKNVCILLWGILFISFIFIFVDFTLYAREKKDMNDLAYIVKSDPVAKIANRAGIDSILSKYHGKPVPEHFAILMISLSNLADINQEYSRLDGNRTIRAFSMILQSATMNKMFVGRNSGDRFIVIIENASPETILLFKERLNDKVEERNSNEKNPKIEYKIATAFHENVIIHDVSDFIALANKRLDEA
jgi:diguanylate cyclase (GGDEF)-like protein